MTTQKGLLNKILVFGIILLLICISITSSSGYISQHNSTNFDYELWYSEFFNENDTTPPITNCTIDPPEPDGENGWYISNISVELVAIDDLSGVKEIRISVCDGPEIVIPGNYVNFFFNEDYKDYYIDYWAIDYSGNIETKNRFYINIDKTKPEISLIYDVYWYYRFREIRFMFSAYSTDSTSGMDRVEFYMNNNLQEIVVGPGERYWWIWKPTNYTRIFGFILNPEILDEFINFYSLFTIVRISSIDGNFYAYAYDKAGNMNNDYIILQNIPGVNDFLLFQDIKIKNNYTGYIGRFFIDIFLDS